MASSSDDIISAMKGVEDPDASVRHGDLNHGSRIAWVSGVHTLRCYHATLRVHGVLHGVPHELHQDVAKGVLGLVVRRIRDHQRGDTTRDGLDLLDVRYTADLDRAPRLAQGFGLHTANGILETDCRSEASYGTG